MTNTEKQVLLDTTLERAGELLGDISPIVYAAYYRAYPEAQGTFDVDYAGGRTHLEGSMVEQVLYCLMRFFESPEEIEFLISYALTHHIEDLGVGGGIFAGLISAVVDVIASTIPDERLAERVLLAELHTHLLGLVERHAKR